MSDDPRTGRSESWLAGEPSLDDPDHESHFGRPEFNPDFANLDITSKSFYQQVLDDPELLELLVECRHHTDLFGKTFLPDAFTEEFSDEHRKIFKIIDDDSQHKSVLAAPRSFGKTTICSLALAAKHICYRTSRLIIPLSASVSQCVLQSENLKDELNSNERIQQVFGPMKTDKWSRERWVTKTGTMVYPRGAEQKLRGVKWGHIRPNLFIVDDLEDDEAVQNSERRQKLKEWFFGALMKSIHKFGGWWRVIVIGTVLHEDSLLMSLIKSDDWKSEILEICDDLGRSKWPQHTTDDEIAKEREQYRALGILHVWYREMRNMVIAPEDADFPPKYYKSYEEQELRLSKQQQLRTCILVDPAQTSRKSSAYSAVVCVSVDRQFHRIYLRDISAGLFHPHEMYEKIFEMASRFDCHMLGVEVNALHEYITGPLENMMSMTGYYMQVEEINQLKDKEERIRALSPYYRYGLVYHEKSIAPLIEEQLMTFPRSRRIDIADAFANVIPLMKRFGVIMLHKDPRKPRLLADSEPQYVRPHDPPGVHRDRYGYVVKPEEFAWRVCP